MDTIGERLKIERERLGLTQPGFAAAGGVQRRAQINYEQGVRMPGAVYLAGIARLGADIRFILTGRESQREAGVCDSVMRDNVPAAHAGAVHIYCEPAAYREPEGYLPENVQPLSGYVPVPYFTEIAVSAGDGGAVNADTPAVLMLSADWVHQHFGLPPYALCLVRGDDDAMAPALRSGSVVLVDRSASRWGSDGIYLVRIDDRLMIRRIQWLPGGELRVASDNAQFLSFNVVPEDVRQGRVALLGRAMWNVCRL